MDNDVGIGPENSLIPMPNRWRFGRVRPKLFGRVPLIWFSEIEMIVKDDIFQREGGTIPVSLFEEVVKIDKLFRWPISSRIFFCNIIEGY